MTISYVELELFIREISNMHTRITNEFPGKEDVSNFKSTTTTKIWLGSNQFDEKFDRTTKAYLEYLNNSFNTIVTDLNQVFGQRSDIGCLEGMRVKNYESLVGKLKRSQENVAGGIPLNKLINDLMGIRLVGDFDAEESKRITLYNDLKEKELVFHKNIKSDEGVYNAFHLYFKTGNKSYPWEIQLWPEKYRQMNIDSHVMHDEAKPGYL